MTQDIDLPRDHAPVDFVVVDHEDRAWHSPSLSRLARRGRSVAREPRAVGMAIRRLRRVGRRAAPRDAVALLDRERRMKRSAYAKAGAAYQGDLAAHVVCQGPAQ